MELSTISARLPWHVRSWGGKIKPADRNGGLELTLTGDSVPGFDIKTCSPEFVGTEGLCSMLELACFVTFKCLAVQHVGLHLCSHPGLSVSHIMVGSGSLQTTPFSSHQWGSSSPRATGILLNPILAGCTCYHIYIISGSTYKLMKHEYENQELCC